MNNDISGALFKLCLSSLLSGKTVLLRNLLANLELFNQDIVN